MSAKIVGAVWELDLPQSEAWVLMALADHAHHDGTGIYAGQELLAWKTNYSVRQVRRILDALEKRGLIVPENLGIGRGVIQGYRINLAAGKRKPAIAQAGNNRTKRPVIEPEKEDRLSDEKGTNCPVIENEKPDILTPKTGHFDQENRTFSNEKPDILTPAHDKERARLTGRTMENHGEPTAERAREAEPAQATNLAAVILAEYAPAGTAAEGLRADARREAKKLADLGALPEVLKVFLDSRRKLPSLNWLATDFAAWQANETRGANHAPAGETRNDRTGGNRSNDRKTPAYAVREAARIRGKNVL